jgi:hypothetical protein
MFNEHNYKPLPGSILTKQKLNNSLKRKAVDNMFTRPSKMLHSELNDIKNITSENV